MALLLPVGVAAADASRPPRAALFRAPGFPTADAPVIDDATLATALSGLSIDEQTAIGSGNARRIYRV